MFNSSIFVDVIVPLALNKLYSYSVPIELQAECEIGKRVIVQFGKKKQYTAIIARIHETVPSYETKNILSVLDETPIVRKQQLDFWKWITSYYLCTMGEVFKSALPSGLKLESETKVLFTAPEGFALSELSGKEQILFRILQDNPILSILDLQNKVEGNILGSIKSMMEKKLVSLEEKLKTSYKPKLKNYVRLHASQKADKQLEQSMNALGRARKQLEILMVYLKLSGYMQGKPEEVSQADLLKATNTSTSILKGLLEKEILEVYSKQIDRLLEEEKTVVSEKELNEQQTRALFEIKTLFETISTVLLHGVTSSGKTEVYIHLMKQAIAQGKQVLYLLPEIALTTQIITRLQKVFGNQVGVYHSKFSDSERVELWQSMLNDPKRYPVILGVRSSVFLPFKDLGLIIVDEEHENTYKQFHPAPRYNARDASMVLAQLHGAKVLLGSATPSIESYFNAKTSKYGLVEMTERYKNIQLPEILIADLREARRKKQMKSLFSPLLMNSIESALNNKEQVILFQNRRGFAPYVECHTCNWVPKCEYCDVSLTYHKHSNNLVCHYCGYATEMPKRCGACNNVNLHTQGFGTERIEDEISIFFPEIRTARMDLDTTRSKKSYQRIISEFENKQVDILIGTQMVSKGLDFDNVSLVGIMNADNMLNYPDFRAFERSFQLMTQVSGRAGRKKKQGKVIIQTSDKQNKIIQKVITNDFYGVFLSQLNERKAFKYPPYYRLIKLTLKNKKSATLDLAADELVLMLRKYFGNRILGPEAPGINRIQNWYQKNILIKIETNKSHTKAKALLMNEIDTLRADPRFKSTLVLIDVDPM